MHILAQSRVRRGEGPIVCEQLPYMANLSWLEQKTNIDGKTFAVAASFNNEMSNLVNDSTENVRG